ncbi:MAG: hypothetical protein KIT58_13380 [Planctomycetota bacterium]|nr:hypothetical protein [Planctomycetota bacterium]
MKIDLDDQAADLVFALLGLMRRAAADEAASPLAPLASAGHKRVLMLDVIESLLRGCESGLSEEDRERLCLRVTAIGDQIAAAGGDS